MREKLFAHGAETFQDYELLEMLLFTAIPRRDVKPIAKKLLNKFQNLWALLNAPPQQLQDCGLSETAVAALLITGAVALRAQKAALFDRPLLDKWQRIVDYCRASLAHKTKEECRLLFFDRKNHLIAEEIHQTGTIDHTPVYPREIVERALAVGAGALVIVHNHPSGDVTPSKTDIEMTRAIFNACQALGITIHDHLIIGRTETASFKTLGLL